MMKSILISLSLLIPFSLALSVKAETIPVNCYGCEQPNQIVQNNASLTLGQAADLITQWLNAKSQIFAPPYDRRIVGELTTGNLYTDTLKAINFLIENNAYYQYGVQKVESVEQFAASGNKATIEVRVTEDTTLYQNGRVTESTFNTKVVRYNLENWDGIWKIANSQVLN